MQLHATVGCFPVQEAAFTTACGLRLLYDYSANSAWRQMCACTPPSVVLTQRRCDYGTGGQGPNAIATLSTKRRDAVKAMQ